MEADYDRDDSCKRGLPEFAYITTSALVMDEANEIVDLEASTDELNRIAGEGWVLITVDQGIAYWCMDMKALACVTEYEEERCGGCATRDGNLCTETGFSVTVSDAPHRDGCFKPIGQKHAE